MLEGVSKMIRYLYRELNTSDRDKEWVEDLEFFQR